MRYAENKNNKTAISSLGLGCMRFPKKGVGIDINASAELFKYAVDNGVNYFDTAYAYPGSEEALGECISRTGYRDKINIATKVPPYKIHKYEDFDKIFNTQLSRLKTDYIDYYLIHMLNNAETLDRMVSLGFERWVEEKKQSGKIKNIGFSYHGGRNEFPVIIDRYNFDFCMIQYNYVDENNQAGKSGLKYANEKGLNVFIMEPLRGGTLVKSLPAGAKKVFNRADKEKTLAEWSLRWLFDQKEVSVVVSGACSVEQLKQNISLTEKYPAGNLSEEERLVYPKVIEEINKVVKVSCTACGYCMPCPKNVDIPTCFTCYNETYSESLYQGLKHYVMNTGGLSGKYSCASECIDCKKCEKECPQHIEISKQIKKVKRKMESFWFRPLLYMVRVVTGVNKKQG